jgi:hypothetical protein
MTTGRINQVTFLPLASIFQSYKKTYYTSAVFYLLTTFIAFGKIRVLLYISTDSVCHDKPFVVGITS